MRKWILTICLLSASLVAACSGSAGRALQEGETVNLSDAPAENNSIEEAAPSTQPDSSNLFAEANQLYDQLEANTPIEVAPANASAQTGVVTIPSLF